MSINKIDYEVLTEGKSVYANQAAAIGEVLNAMQQMNSSLADGWTNQTVTAFLDRFDAEYKPAMENIRDAIQSISDYISSYSENEQARDADSASRI